MQNNHNQGRAAVHTEHSTLERPCVSAFHSQSLSSQRSIISLFRSELFSSLPTAPKIVLTPSHGLKTTVNVFSFIVPLSSSDVASSFLFQNLCAYCSSALNSHCILFNWLTLTHLPILNWDMFHSKKPFLTPKHESGVSPWDPLLLSHHPYYTVF